MLRAALAGHIPSRPTVADRLPDDGTVGALRRERPALYWLTLVVAAAAYAGVLASLAFALALGGVAMGHALAAAVGGAPAGTAAWAGLVVLAAAYGAASTLAAVRWVGQYRHRDGEAR